MLLNTNCVKLQGFQSWLVENTKENSEMQSPPLCFLSHRMLVARRDFCGNITVFAMLLQASSGISYWSELEVKCCTACTFGLTGATFTFCYTKKQSREVLVCFCCLFFFPVKRSQILKHSVYVGYSNYFSDILTLINS